MDSFRAWKCFNPRGQPEGKEFQARPHPHQLPVRKCATRLPAVEIKFHGGKTFGGGKANRRRRSPNEKAGSYRL
ncbi:MAG: hypothetical protein H0X40_02945 [Chthoniobacterales bacterium]|nr:hypothetical protein [Chthoniobacterales bacterium]